jgi:protocatechuate 3,4-dioxygenase beta subunit
MKGLIKENYASLRLQSWLVLTAMFLISNSPLFAQFCNIKVASEPMVQTVSLSPSIVTQSTEKNFNQWSNFASLDSAVWNIKGNLAKPGFTTVLKFSDFKFNLPIGATINGIRVKVKGRSEGSGAFNEEKIQLATNDVRSMNRNEQGYNSKNVFIRSNSSMTWNYGTNTDTWGRLWTPAQINSTSFGLEMQLTSVSSKSISALIENLSIEVSYTGAPTFCTTDCFPVYSKLDNPAVHIYKWKLPAGFELISRSENHYIVDLKPLKATNGLHTISVDALDVNGKVLQSCLRTLRIRNCTPSTLGNRVWNDLNFNGLQDAGEPGLANVRVVLIDALTNREIATQTTNASGQYLFTNLKEGSYRVKVAIPQEFATTISAKTDTLNSDFITNTDASKNIFLEFNTNMTSVDFGLIRKLTLGDFVWEDLNCNGLQDANEPGIKDVKVRLLDSLNTVIDTATTDAAGKYSLKGLALKYKVKFLSGAELIPVISSTLNAGTNSDINDKSETAIINFTDKSADNTIDAGYLRYGSIGNQIWVDTDGDQLFDTNEKGSPNIKVDLYNESNVLVNSDTTDAMGNYLFSNVVPGKYKVQAILPDRAILTGSAATQTFKSLGSNNYSTELLTLKSGENKANIDLGYILPSSAISGRMWNDTDADGIYKIGEELVGEFKVSLIKEGTVLKSAITDQKGEYKFDNLLAGNYLVKFEIDDELQITQKDKGSDQTDSDVYIKDNMVVAGPFEVGNTDTLSNVDAGIVRKSVIGDYVWEDVNNDGIQDSIDRPITGVKVILFNSAGVAIDSTRTDDNGEYLLQKISAGSYSIKIISPSGYVFVSKGIGAANKDSDVDSEGNSGSIVLSIGEDNLNVDAGLVKLISLGDFVWLDANADGIQQADEAGIANVKMSLLDEKMDIVSTTTTDIAGKYEFANVRPGKYIVKLDIPESFTISPLNSGDNEINNDFSIDGATELATYLTSTNNIDGGLYRTSCIKGFTWTDTDEDGIYNPALDTKLGQVVVQLVGEDSNIMTMISSVEDGSYNFCNLLPGNYILKYLTTSEYKPTSKGVDSPLNSLLDNYFTDTIKVSSGSNISSNAGFLFNPILQICGLAWDDINADGVRQEDEQLFKDFTLVLMNSRDSILSFQNTSPNGFYCFSNLEKGSYRVKFVVPPTMQITKSDVGLDSLDSDAIEIGDTVITNVITLTTSSVRNVDIGLTNRSIIGDLVWYDDNEDGIYDTSENGAPGYIVRLYNEAGEEIDLTGTSVNGAYLFFNIKSGKYRLSFDKDSTERYTIKDLDETKGSDADTLGFTEFFTVEPNKDYYDFDAGIIRKKLSISGKALLDENKDKIQNDGDKPISTRVILLNEKSEKISEIVTNADGQFAFDNLNAGKYFLKFDTLPFLDLYKENESDANTMVTNEFGYGTTRLIDLVEGRSKVSNAFYFDARSKITGRLFYNIDGSEAYVAGTSSNLSNKKVYLQNKNGFIIDSTFSNADGIYTFGKLEVDNYFVEWTLPSEDTLLVGKKVSDTIAVPFCTIISNIDASYTGRGNISGLAFVDTDENGLDNAPAKLNGVVFNLVNLAGEVIARDTTKSNNTEFGFYKFNNIKAGKYKVEVLKPLLYVFTAPNAENNSRDQEDSDFTANRTLSATSDTIMVLSNNNVLDLDAGFIPRAPNNSSISGVAWTDELVNGIREGNERLRANIALSLCNAQGVEISKTTTNELGRYTFSNLAEGFYLIKSELPSDETASLFRQGTDTLVDNDFNSLTVKNTTSTFYVGISEMKNSNDLGIATMAMIGDFVWEDTNLNGIQDGGEKGIPNINVTALTPKGDAVAKARTDANGKYTIENIPIGNYIVFFQKTTGYSPTLQSAGLPTIDSDIDKNGRSKEIKIVAGLNNTIDAGFITNGSIGDRIWVDYNGNGVQQDNEPGIDSIKVSLFQSDNTFVRSTFTASRSQGQAGYYEFVDLAPGDYYIKVDLPKGYKAAPINTTDGDMDSDINEVGKSDLVKVLSGVKMDTLDGGIYLPGCIGDRVWLDANQNGIQDVNEVGIPGIVVRLLRSNGSVLESVTTDVKGDYLFNTLVQGLFQIEVEVPSTYILSTPKAGDDGNRDCDFFATNSNRTPLISLAHAAKIYDIDAGLSLKTNVGPEKKEEDKLNLYNPIPFPNPALSAIQFDIPFTSCELSIYASTGNLAMRLVGYQKNQTVDISGLKAGIYHAIAREGGKRVGSRFIKVD